MKNAKVKSTLPFWFAFAASAVMLTVIQPPVGWATLAWVALVPFVLACSPAVKPKPLALAAYVVSIFYWLGNLYWVAPITIVGWAAFCLYTALLWPIAAIALRYCRIRKIPLFLAVPVVFVGAERLQGFLLGGFFWRFLAHSQYNNTTIIQIADVFGAAGVSFLIAMVNGLISELIIRAGQRTRANAGYYLKIALVCAAVAATVLYGRWRISQSDRFVTSGPLVASVQSNIPQSVKRSFKAGQEIFDSLMTDSNEAVKAGAELVVWPETMVQAILNTEVWPSLNESDKDRPLHEALRQHARNTAFLLVGAYGTQVRQQDDSDYLARFNSAFLYRPDGTQAGEKYSKIHLVPFGEFVPFRRSIPSVYNLLMKFTPYNYHYSLDPGTEYTVFKMNVPSKEQPHRFSVMICYEDTVPAIARRFALDSRGQKRIDWLVNISNDGWFVRFKGDEVIASTELPQHVAVCAFRAVENRLAVVRSVNTGISCLIDTLGRVQNGFVAGNLPHNAMQRKGMAGWFADKVPIDKRISPFSRSGQWLDSACAVCLAGLVAGPALIRFVRRKR